jgi:hypothetical protein
MVDAMIQEGNREVAQCQDRVQKMIYTAWNVWKERRVFDKKAISENQLQAIIKIDVQQWRVAWGRLTDIT